ncbi:ArsR/SmtB family transcription factor [Jatrophihabitans sp. DSM 45814]
MTRTPPRSRARAGASAVSNRDPVVLTDPRAIKALAHPARLAVIDEFFNGRRLTATECAEIAGLSASAMSYHLRALEKWGIIRRSEATPDGRERPWEAAGDGLRLESSEPRASLAGESVLINRILDRQRADALNWIDRDHEAHADWKDVMTLSSHGAWLTAAEAQQLALEMQAVLDRYERKDSDTGPDGKAADSNGAMRFVQAVYSVIPTERANS